LTNSAINKRLSQTNPQTINQIAKFHAQFEAIHPFLDGNGRIGRGIILKQCLLNNVFLFVINHQSKKFYYDALIYFQQTKKVNLLVKFFNDKNQYQSYFNK
jgi:Fic family protein